MSVRPLACMFITALALCAAAPAAGYNHEQHQGVVALGYKAMVAASLELGCLHPEIIPQARGNSVRNFRAEFCDGQPDGCEARWSQLLSDIEGAIPYLRSIGSGLAPPRPACADPRGGVSSALGDVGLAVDPTYPRDPADALDGRGTCGVPRFARCSMPGRLCNADGLWRYLAPDDHTGDVLGFWATEPDDDESVSTLGFKPTSGFGIGTVVNLVKDGIDITAVALLAPLACLIHVLDEGDLDCLDDARSLADAIPYDEALGLVPVIGELRDAAAFTGFWHFQQNVPGASNQCDDRQGLLYEEAGPQLVPDALDLGIMILGDAVGLTLNYDESTGPKRFNDDVRDPRDGDPPACARDRTEWELQTLGHTAFSPLDNLAFYGWRKFAAAPKARDLGWPLHAIVDAVAPHHVVATTGWGHRPFEDAAEVYWKDILYMDRGVGNPEAWRLQYEQLRRILGWALHYARALDRLRAERPTSAAVNAIPIRALITQIAAETLAETTAPDTGAPGWPFDRRISVPYILDAALGTQVLTNAYGSGASIDRMRGLMERGAGAVVAFLASTWRVEDYVPPPPPGRCQPGVGGGFFECGPYAACELYAPVTMTYCCRSRRSDDL